MWLKVDSRLINLDHVASINVIDCAPKDRDLKTLYIQQGNMHENLVSGKAKDIDSLRNCIVRALRREDVNLLDVDKLITLTTRQTRRRNNLTPMLLMAHSEEHYCFLISYLIALTMMIWKAKTMNELFGMLVVVMGIMLILCLLNKAGK